MDDVIDPDPQYCTDRWKSRLAEVLTLVRRILTAFTHLARRCDRDHRCRWQCHFAPGDGGKWQRTHVGQEAPDEIRRLQS